MMVFMSYRNTPHTRTPATVVLRYEYLETQKTSTHVEYKSEAAVTEFDCGKGTQRVVSTTMYADNNLRGSSLSESNQDLN